MRRANLEPNGNLDLQFIGGQREAAPLSARELLHAIIPAKRQPREVRRYKIKNFLNAYRGLRKIHKAAKYKIPTMYGTLTLRLIRSNGDITNFGIVSTRVVTTVGVNFIRDAFLNTQELENMKYHAFGTGTNAEAVGDTALQTEFTTEYAVNSTRVTGSQVSGGAGAYQTVATFTPDSGGTLAVTEHGVLSQAATGGGTLLDRSKFAAVNLDTTAGDSLQATYTITFTAGG